MRVLLLKSPEIGIFALMNHHYLAELCIPQPLSPFCGSGSQIIAAEKLDRRCFAIEKEPVFVDVAIERWEQWTGRKAKLERLRSADAGG